MVLIPTATISCGNEGLGFVDEHVEVMELHTLVDLHDLGGF